MRALSAVILCAALAAGCNRHDPREEELAREAQRQKQAAEAAAQVEQARKQAEEAAAKAAAAKAARFEKALSWTVVDKGFQPKDVAAGRYEDVLFARAEYVNQSGADIRSFAGTVFFKDENGAVVLSGKIKVDEPLAAGARGSWRAQKNFDQFNDDDVRMKDTNMKQVRLQWVPRTIVYADGTSMGQAP